MNLQFHRRTVIAVLIILSSMVLAAVAFANASTHWTTGTGGTHSTGSHPSNPGHLWAAVKADHTGSITSGGRFHDGCGTTSTDCFGAFSGSDWALDIGGGGGTTAKLYLDITALGSGASPAPDNNRNMAVYAYVAAQGNFRSDPVGRPACNWQKLDILASYYDSAGNPYLGKVIGHMWIAHLGTFTNAVGTTITTNVSKPNTFGGTGTIWYVDGVSLGTIYNGGDVVGGSGGRCSTGAHTHVEFLSDHAWGSEYEWHSSAGPDSYGGLSGVSTHIHGTAGGTWVLYNPVAADSVTQGTSILGHYGGDKTLFYMRDNPNNGSH